MITADIPFVFVIAVVMTLLLAALCASLDIGCRVARIFMVLVAAIWLGGKLYTPLGPLLWGVPWLTFFIVGLISTAAYLACMLGSRSITRVVAKHLDALGFYRTLDRREGISMHLKLKHRGPA